LVLAEPEVKSSSLPEVPGVVIVVHSIDRIELGHAENG
jgi:hypothetical protein